MRRTQGIPPTIGLVFRLPAVVYPFLDLKAKQALAEWRADLGQLLRRTSDALQFDGSTVTWWTFAGGRINQTLKYAIERQGRWKVVPDSFSVKIQGDGVSIDSLSSVLDELRAPGFWTDDQQRARAPEPRPRVPAQQVPARPPRSLASGDDRRVPAGLRRHRAVSRQWTSSTFVKVQ